MPLPSPSQCIAGPTVAAPRRQSSYSQEIRASASPGARVAVGATRWPSAAPAWTLGLYSIATAKRSAPFLPLPTAIERISRQRLTIILTLPQPRPSDAALVLGRPILDRKSTRLNSSHLGISYA